MNENTPEKSLEAVYLPLKAASERIGLPVHYLRKGVKEERFPYQKVGIKYYLNIPGTLRLLEQDKSAREGAGDGDN